MPTRGVDIPFLGMYYIYQGVSEGQHDLATLSIAREDYDLGKVMGMFILYFVGLSIEQALIINMTGSITALVYIVLRILSSQCVTRVQ